MATFSAASIYYVPPDSDNVLPYYSDPHAWKKMCIRDIFFDEATNSLDANNERAIVENLTDFYRGKTVIIVAHRLSTVRNADQIVVLDKGRIVEVGTHDVLIDRKGAYYNLVRCV